MEATPEDSCREAAAALAEVGSLLFRALSDREGMTLTTASTMMSLEQDGPLRLTALASAEGIAQPSMTVLVQRLERQGLASRVTDPEDGRACLVGITEAGRELLAERRRNSQARLTDLLAALPEQDLRALGEAMNTTLPLVKRAVCDSARVHVPRGEPMS